MSAHWFTGSISFAKTSVSPGFRLLHEGQTYLRRGWFVEAAATLSLAVEHLGDQPGPWAQLGQAWVGIDQSRKARACLERSLSLDPDQPAVWNNLGILQAHAGETPQALEAFRRTLVLQPGFQPAQRGACLALYAMKRGGEAEAILPDSSERSLLEAQALREAGDLEGAAEAYRNAIRALEIRDEPALKAQEPPYSPEGARQALWAAKERLDAAGIEFFLMAGTLLGVVRNGDLLPHDKDLDLGVAWGVSREGLVNTLCAGGLFTVPWDQGILPPERPWFRGFLHTGSGSRLDVFFLQPEGGTLLSGFDCLPRPVHCRLSAFGLKDWPWRGETWKVPDPPENYLAEVYGPGWRIPDLHYDTVLSNPARTPESRPVVLCMSYLRLYTAVQDRKWARARALIGQIQARTGDPFLEDLLARINQVIPMEGKE
jgi:hypothetical protein